MLDPRILTAIACALCVVLGSCGGAGTAGNTGVGGLPALDNVPLPGGQGGGVAPVAELQGGVLGTFETGGRLFRVGSDGEAGLALARISWGATEFVSISGRLGKGTGAGDHNAPWSWHLSPGAARVNYILASAPTYVGTIEEIEADYEDIVRQGLEVVFSTPVRLVRVDVYRGPDPDPPSPGGGPVY